MIHSKILVAGGMGKLGSALGRLGANALGRNAMDIMRADSIHAAFSKYDPDVVINCTAYTNVDQAETDAENVFALNHTATKLLAEICAANDLPILHISTDCVFGDRDPSSPVTETSPTDPLSVYGKSKHQGEMAVQAASGVHCIARVSWLFNDGHDSFIGKMLNIAQGRDAMQIVDDAYGRPTEVTALAVQLLALAERLQRGEQTPTILHLGPADPVSRFEWAEAIFAASAALGGPSPDLTPCSSDVFKEPARRPRGLVLDTTLADSLIGPAPNWQMASNKAVANILSKKGDGA
ncbi:MAG: dTDP-4-dehydrorhamnose reductase [Hyphomonadaceae bacterium]